MGGKNRLKWIGLQHNGEGESCGLLIEVGLLPLLQAYVVQADRQRVCLSLLACAPLTPIPDNRQLISQARDLYLKFGKRLEALRCAVMLNDVEGIKEIFLGTLGEGIYAVGQ